MRAGLWRSEGRVKLGDGSRARMPSLMSLSLALVRAFPMFTSHGLEAQSSREHPKHRD